MRWLRVCIYVGATLFTIFSLSLSITCFVLESPSLGGKWVEAALSPEVDIAGIAGILVAAVGLVVDVLLFLLPLVAVYKLQLHHNRRVGVTVIFSTGLM